jgi:hypothetical protein
MFTSEAVTKTQLIREIDRMRYYVEEQAIGGLGHAVVKLEKGCLAHNGTRTVHMYFTGYDG